MTEKQFENKVKEYLHKQGCWILKTWSNGIQREGIPDLLVCCNGYFLGIELKAEKGKPTDLQIWNIKRINQSYGFGFVLRPSNFELFKSFITLLNADISYYAARDILKKFEGDYYESV